MNVQIRRWGRGVGFYLFVSVFCILTVSPITFLLVGCANTRQSASLTAEAPSLTEVQQSWLSKANRHERAGWVYVHIEGTPRQRGFQHGYLLAKEIAQGIKATRTDWEYESATKWSWLLEKASAMFARKIDKENLAELDGIVEGMQAAGVPSSRAEIIAYNGYLELDWYWWPEELKKIKEGKVNPAHQSCSAFIATGSMTADGGVVLGHNTMNPYYFPLPNVILAIVPEKGHRILMQTYPGWISSGTDFFITDAGLVGAETTIFPYDEGIDLKGVPEFSRMRRASQDANSIEEWCAIMKHGNNGGLANAWLLGNVNTGEIARLELGLKYVGFEKKRDGYFVGSNVAEDLKILRFETTLHETDIRESDVARRVRWKQLMSQYAGRIDVEAAKLFEADHFDAYLGEEHPGERSLCAHGDLERKPIQQWPTEPNCPFGTIDAKVVDTKMARQMSFAARWGSACGMAFDAQKFLAEHPQYEWMKDILQSRPSEPWTTFAGGEQRATDAWTDKSPHKVGFITVNGVRLHYLDWGGSGDTLLLLTGMGETAHIYDDLAPKFTDRFHVLGLTRRGQGQSEKPETGYDTATLVEDIRQFLDAMKIQRVSLVGHSLAGDELTMFAAKYPQRVEKLVYLDAAYDHSTVPSQDEELWALFPRFPEHDNKSYDASKAWYKKFFRVMTPAVEADLRETSVLHDDGRLEDATPERVYKALKKLTQPNPAYAEVKAPVLSFYADDFWPDLIPNENREKATIVFEALRQWRTVERDRFRQGMPQARIVLMPDTSHYCFIQRESEVVREMRAFLLQR